MDHFNYVGPLIVAIKYFTINFDSDLAINFYLIIIIIRSDIKVF